MTEKYTINRGPDPTCYFCEKPLRKWHKPSEWWNTATGIIHWGAGGNDYFCTARCAFSWAVRKASSQFNEGES